MKQTSFTCVHRWAGIFQRGLDEAAARAAAHRYTYLSRMEDILAFARSLRQAAGAIGGKTLVLQCVQPYCQTRAESTHDTVERESRVMQLVQCHRSHLLSRLPFSLQVLVISNGAAPAAGSGESLGRCRDFGWPAACAGRGCRSTFSCQCVACSLLVAISTPSH